MNYVLLHVFSLTLLWDITQWSVLAIHNICKNNDENKAVLASLKFGGLADDAEVLRKYGIEAEVKDNKVIVKPPSENK